MSVAELHLFATAFMAGVIVFVQVVHYPLMDGVGSDRFSEYERRHTYRTGWVVIPPMLVELGTALWLAVAPPTPGLVGLAQLNLALLAVIWLSTALLQAPAHSSLVRGFDPAVHRRLVSTNWIRTVTWLARLPVALLLAGS